MKRLIIIVMLLLGVVGSLQAQDIDNLRKKAAETQAKLEQQKKYAEWDQLQKKDPVGYLDLMSLEAEKGDIEAILRLGLCLDFSIDGDSEYLDKSLSLYRRAIAANESLFFKKVGVVGPASRKIYEEYANNGNMYAAMEMANISSRREEALKWYKIAAAKGNAEAKAKCHEIQMSIAVDQKAHRPAPDLILPPRLTMTQERLKDIDKQCREWAKSKTKSTISILSDKLLSRFNDCVEIYKQALKGDPECQYWMGDFYSWGDWAGRNVSEGLRWYYLAAKQGYAPAEELIGHSYREGWNGVKRHSFEAAKWFARAEAHEKERAVFWLGQMWVYREITKEEFRIANELVHNDWQKVMKRGIYLANVAGEANNAANNKKNENNQKYAHFYGTWTSARGTTFTISTGPYLDLVGAGKFSGEWTNNGKLYVSFGYPDEITLRYYNGYLYDANGRMYWRIGQ